MGRRGGTYRPLLAVLLAAVLIGWIGCDSVTPVDSSLLVVEGFLNTDAPLPEISVHRTLSPDEGYSNVGAAVTTADVDLVLGGEAVSYTSDGERPGTYVPARSDVRTAAGVSYSFRVRWEGSDVETRGVLPPVIEIEDVNLHVPEEPVSAVFLDSLALGDSLTTGAYTGYIYPIEVVVTWDDPAPVSSDSWVRAQLKPYAAFSSTVVDLFLKSDEVQHEQELGSGDEGKRSWTGVYAVGVSDADAPLPEHLLRVSLVRSGEDYARFATSRDNPGRREPISNLGGAAGIFTAVSVDSLHLSVAQDDP